MEGFIAEHFMGKKVAVNCGNDDTFNGVVDNCINGVLYLKQEHGLLYINIAKIVSIREALR